LRDVKVLPEAGPGGLAQKTAQEGTKSRMSATTVGAILVVALVAFGGVYYFSSSTAPKQSNNYFAEQVLIEIGGATANSSATYYPDNFTVTQGEHVTIVVRNGDNLTHGMAISSFSLDTGPILPNGSAKLTFVPNALGNFTFSEPTSDCGGGDCDAGSALSGYFTVSG